MTDLLTQIIPSKIGPIGAHVSNHETGGSDELDITDLAGVAAERQPPIVAQGFVRAASIYDWINARCVPSTAAIYTVELNNGDVANGQLFSAIAQYYEFRFSQLLQFDQWQQYGSTINNGDGEHKLQYYDYDLAAWTDWVTGIATRALASWSGLSSETPIVTDRIRITCTAVDTNGAGSVLPEFEIYNSAGDWPVGSIPVVKHKGTAQQVTNSAVLVDDYALHLPVGAYEDWEFEVWLIYNADAAADIDVTFTVPAGGTLYFALIDDWNGANAPSNATTEVKIDGTGVGIDRIACFKGIYIGGANAGTIQMQWAQNAAQANNAEIDAGSHLKATRLT